MRDCELFELEETNFSKLGKTCRNCGHRERHQCGSKIIQYCGVLKSNKTQNGKKKIKVSFPACNSFKEVTGNIHDKTK